MKLAVTNPNLTVVLPVVCNASCSFCYWKPSSGLTLDKFSFIANTLPDMFKQCSITGGEPTLSRDLSRYIDIAKSRFEKVVLNTNGYRLTKGIVEKVDYVNISRHHYIDSINYGIFNTRTVPSIRKLRRLCGYGDVTLNCVLPDGFSNKEFVIKYIKLAKWCGAKVAFRKYFSNLDILTSIDGDETLVQQHSCPSCLHREHIIDGVKVTFKYSVKETYKNVDGIYELIVQPNGDLTYDWEGKNKLEYKDK